MALCNMCMRRCIQKVIPFRTDTYIDALVSKLADEGIRYAREMVQATKASVEMKLSSNQSFKMGEVNDCLTIWSAVQRSVEIEADIKQGIRQGPHHYCAHVNHDDASRKRKHGSLSREESDAYSRSTKIRRHSTSAFVSTAYSSHEHVKQEPVAEEDLKSDLWKAIEAGDDASVADLLHQGADAEERYKGWTPLMKAAEEDHVDIARMLLDASVDINAVNKKGRTAVFCSGTIKSSVPKARNSSRDSSSTSPTRC